MIKKAIIGLGILGCLLSRETPLAMLLGFVMMVGSLAEETRSSEPNRVPALMSTLPRALSQITQSFQRLFHPKRSRQVELGS
jgi:hypothetical protein